MEGNRKMKDQCSIIYNTCDKYECLWKGFFTLFNKYWSSCDLEIILNTEKKNYVFSDLNIKRPNYDNSDISWSKRIMNSLNSVNTPYVIMMLDDFWLKESVNVSEISRCINMMNDDIEIKCINFAKQPGPNKKYLNENIYERRGRVAPYRVNAQIALWRVDYLKKILKSYENPWQFELSGSFRSMLYGGIFLSIKDNHKSPFVYDYGFLIVRGMINKELATYFSEKEDIRIDFPFKEYNPKEYYDNKKGKLIRILGYVTDAIISLFRK